MLGQQLSVLQVPKGTLRIRQLLPHIRLLQSLDFSSAVINQHIQFANAEGRDGWYRAGLLGRERFNQFGSPRGAGLDIRLNRGCQGWEVVLDQSATARVG